MNEEWRPVTFCMALADHEVSDLGRIRTADHVISHIDRSQELRFDGRAISWLTDWSQWIQHKTGRLLKPALDGRGYLAISGKWGNPIKVHRIVLFTFLGRPEPGQVARHLNGVKTDNRLENLCWGTHSENLQDRKWQGIPKKLSVGQIVDIKSRLDDGDKLIDLAGEFNVSISLIHRIKTNKIHADV